MSVAGIYKQTAVTTQSKGKIVVLLYEGAIRFLKQALMSIDKKDYAGKNECIQRASKIITELNVVLDMEQGGEIAVNLRKLYNFMLEHLFKANAELDKQKIHDVISMLENLNSAWKEIA